MRKEEKCAQKQCCLSLSFFGFFSCRLLIPTGVVTWATPGRDFGFLLSHCARAVDHNVPSSNNVGTGGQEAEALSRQCTHSSVKVPVANVGL